MDTALILSELIPNSYFMYKIYIIYYIEVYLVNVCVCIYIYVSYVICRVSMLYCISLNITGYTTKHSTPNYFLLARCPFGRSALLNLVLHQLNPLVLPTLIKSIRKIHFIFGFINLLIAPLGKLKLFGRYLTGILYAVFCRTLNSI